MACYTSTTLVVRLLFSTSCFLGLGMKLVLTINKTHIHADYVNGTVIELMGIDEINRVAVGLRYACVTLSYTRRVADLGGSRYLGCAAEALGSCSARLAAPGLRVGSIGLMHAPPPPAALVDELSCRALAWPSSCSPAAPASTAEWRFAQCSTVSEIGRASCRERV